VAWLAFELELCAALRDELVLDVLWLVWLDVWLSLEDTVLVFDWLDWTGDDCLDLDCFLGSGCFCGSDGLRGSDGFLGSEDFLESDD
jgi:hypothetical protein